MAKPTRAAPGRMKPHGFERLELITPAELRKLHGRGCSCPIHKKPKGGGR